MTSNIVYHPAAGELFGYPFPPAPQPTGPCPGDDEFEEWKKQIGGGGNKQQVVKGQGSSMPFLGPAAPPRKSVVFYVIGLVGSEDGYFVDLSTESPYSTHDPDETNYPNGYLTLELSLSEWNTLMVGQVIPTTLTL